MNLDRILVDVTAWTGFLSGALSFIDRDLAWRLLIVTAVSVLLWNLLTLYRELSNRRERQRIADQIGFDTEL